MQDKHDMPLITADDTVEDIVEEKSTYSHPLQITLCLANLMMTGSATPYLHNGIMDPGEGDDPNFDVSLQKDFLLCFLTLHSMETGRWGSRAGTRSDCSSGKPTNI